MADTEIAKIEFTEEQQAYVNKLIGDARTKARSIAEKNLADKTAKEKADAEVVTLAAEKKWQELAERHEARAKELEQYEARAKSYDALVATMLKDKMKSLGAAAKKFVGSLPESLGAIEKLELLNANADLFLTHGDQVGTPGRTKAVQKTKSDAKEGHKRLRM